jgi:hypothetical protein
MYTEVEDETLKDAIDFLIYSFNDEAGLEAIVPVESQDQANSTIRFKSGLRNDGDKLGYGQWKTWTALSEDGFVLSERTVTKTITYSMDVVFDYENFRDKASNPDRTSGDWAHIYHLFCHEIGHGLQMGHDANVNSVMYETIPEESRPRVDYVAFFKRARSFFNRSSEEN